MKLVRPRSNRIIAGVCAGVAQRFGWRPNAVRLAAIISCILPGPQFLLYILLWILIPTE